MLVTAHMMSPQRLLGCTAHDRNLWAVRILSDSVASTNHLVHVQPSGTEVVNDLILAFVQNLSAT